MTTATDTPTTLYRMFDTAGALLYVGISFSPLDRIGLGHRTSKHWWLDVARITLTHFTDREAAARAELEAIWTEAPRWNARKAIDGQWQSGRSSRTPDLSEDEIKRIARSAGDAYGRHDVRTTLGDVGPEFDADLVSVFDLVVALGAKQAGLYLGVAMHVVMHCRDRGRRVREGAYARERARAVRAERGTAGEVAS